MDSNTPKNAQNQVNVIVAVISEPARVISVPLIPFLEEKSVKFTGALAKRPS